MPPTQSFASLPAFSPAPLSRGRAALTRLLPALLSALSLLTLLSLLLFVSFMSPPSLAAGAKNVSSEEDKTDVREKYQLVKLTEFVPATRMTDGGRAIFEPRPVRFTARLAQLPTPQKADYLKKVMELMGGDANLQVNQRVALAYGGEKPLAAYVGDEVAARIARELKPGDERTFYAFHVYNNRYGPAFVITSFEK